MYRDDLQAALLKNIAIEKELNAMKTPKTRPKTPSKLRLFFKNGDFFAVCAGIGILLLIGQIIRTNIYWKTDYCYFKQVEVGGGGCSRTYYKGVVKVMAHNTLWATDDVLAEEMNIDSARKFVENTTCPSLKE